MEHLMSIDKRSHSLKYGRLYEDEGVMLHYYIFENRHYSSPLAKSDWAGVRDMLESFLKSEDIRGRLNIESRSDSYFYKVLDGNLILGCKTITLEEALVAYMIIDEYLEGV